MHCVEKMALNAKVSSSSLGDKMLAVSSGELGQVHTCVAMYRHKQCHKQCHNNILGVLAVKVLLRCTVDVNLSHSNSGVDRNHHSFLFQRVKFVYGASLQQTIFKVL